MSTDTELYHIARPDFPDILARGVRDGAHRVQTAMLQLMQNTEDPSDVEIAAMVGKALGPTLDQLSRIEDKLDYIINSLNRS